MPKAPEVKEEVKAAWKKKAREMAQKDVKKEKLTGNKAEEYFYERVTYHYKKLKQSATKVVA